MTPSQILLENILSCLQRDLVPELQSPKAAAAAEAMARALARMSVYAGARGEADSPAGWFSADPALRQVHNGEQERGISTQVTDSLRGLYHREWQALAAIEDATEKLLSDKGAAPQDPRVASSEDTTRAKLETYLQRKYSAPEARIIAFHHVVGGRSKQTAFFSVSGIEPLRRELVLRSDIPINLSGGKSVAYEYSLQDVLANHGMKVPRPLLLEADASEIGQSFMVVEKLPGTVAGQYFSPPSSQALLADYAAELARLHAVPLSAFDDLDVEINPLPRESLTAEIEQLRAVCIECGTLSLILETAYAWLLENIEIAYRDRPCLAHRDALFHNVLAQDDRVSAILDWELARVSCAAEDLGYIRSTVPLAMPWETFMRHYEKAAGRTIDQDQVDYFAILSVSRNCSMASNVRRVVVERQSQDIELTSVTLHDLYRMQYQLGEHLNRALGK